MPQNTTGLSILGFIKWALIISSFPCLVKAWQGIILHQSATGYGRYDSAASKLVTGGDALSFGIQNLLLAAVLLAAAWAIWYFWQQYE